jgi:hypothetical protein
VLAADISRSSTAAGKARAISRSDSRRKPYGASAPHLHGGTSGNFHRLFNGFDIERWMLKVLCAVHCDRPVPGSVILEPWRVPRSWLSILFGKARFPRGCGLYKTAPPTRRPLGETSIYVQPIYGRLWPATGSMLPLIVPEAPKTVAGVKIMVLNMELQLLMYPPVDVPKLVYRPHLIRYVNRKTGCGTNLHLGWDESPPTFEGRIASTVEHEFSANAAQRRASLKALRKR